MTTMYDVDSQELVIKAAEELKKMPEIKAPSWAPFVKTGSHKERPPTDNEWWHIRVASVLRTVYRLGPVGVSKLRTKYGGKKNRGVKQERFAKGSGSILRKSLQQLEKEGLIKFTEKGVHKGRVITPKGISFLDKIASQIKGTQPAKQPEMPETAKTPAQSKPVVLETIPKTKALDKAAPHEVAEIKQEQKAVKAEEAAKEVDEYKETKAANKAE